MSRINGDQLEFLEAQEVEHQKLLETKSFAKFSPLVYENWCMKIGSNNTQSVQCCSPTSWWTSRLQKHKKMN